MSSRASFLRKALVSGALVTGVGFGAAGIATAATNSSTGSNAAPPTRGNQGNQGAGNTPAAPPGGRPHSPGGMPNRPGGTPLTGTDLQKADAAAEAAVPGATVTQADSVPSGAARYVVHMKKTDGTCVAVDLDANFNVVKVASGPGPGPGPAGRPAPGGGASGSGAA